MRWSRAVAGKPTRSDWCSVTGGLLVHPKVPLKARGMVRFDQTHLVLYLFHDSYIHLVRRLSRLSCLSLRRRPHGRVVPVISLFVHDRHVRPYPHRRSTRRRRQTHSRDAPARLDVSLKHGTPPLDYEHGLGRHRPPRLSAFLWIYDPPRVVFQNSERAD